MRLVSDAVAAFGCPGAHGCLELRAESTGVAFGFNKEISVEVLGLFVGNGNAKSPELSSR